MTRSAPRIFFGVHSFTPYRKTDGLPYGTIEVLKGSSFELTGELAELFAGSAKYPWAVEETTINAELKIKPAEYPDFLFELFLGKNPTAASAESGGGVSAITNKKGTSVVSATVGIASVGIKSGKESDLKFTKYIVKAVGASTVDVYAMSSVDFGRGTAKDFENDALKITPTPLTIATGVSVEVAGFGVELTGGSGTIALVENDTATFEVRPINQKSMSVVIGAPTDVFPTFSAIIVGQKRGNGEMVELDVYSLKAIGLPLGMEEKAFAEGAEIAAKAMYDSERKGVFGMRHITPA
jgi:hypothetical protein